MLADEIIDGIEGQFGFGGLDVSVRRNAFGNQLDSFEADLVFSGVDGPVHAAFIRAPIVERVGPEVQVLSKLGDGRIVAVRQQNLLGISFHPEVTGENRIHEYFLNMISDAD
jgi:5'-phosphate synthase pdxT subunit